MQKDWQKEMLVLVEQDKEYTHSLTSLRVQFNIPSESEGRVRRLFNANPHLKKRLAHHNDILKVESSLKGVVPMAEPTEADKLALLDECERYGIDVSNVKHFWHKSKRISMFVVAQQRPTYEAVRDELVAQMKKHAPRYPKLRRKKMTDGHLLVVDPADIHIGKLATIDETGFSYDKQKAVAMATEGVHGLLQKASGFPVNKILLVIGNDILHIDTPHRTTTSGTRQDTDGMWHDCFIAARQLYVNLIESLLVHADVDVVLNPSNHDHLSSFMLADALYCWFNNNKQVKFDNRIIHRKYYQYGLNLIATTHGDGARNMDMPLLMAQEAPEMWAATRHRYIYQHHVHHKNKVKWQSVKDYPGITLETLRSPSAPDGWHHRNGYVGAPAAVEAFVHHPEGGQVARLSHIF